jgi:DNA-directed RNA polymerase subunit RPC12/RpoP
MWETPVKLYECGVCEEWFHRCWRDEPKCPYCNSLYVYQVQNPQE